MHSIECIFMCKAVAHTCIRRSTLFAVAVFELFAARSQVGEQYLPQYTAILSLKLLIAVTA